MVDTPQAQLASNRRRSSRKIQKFISIYIESNCRIESEIIVSHQLFLLHVLAIYIYSTNLPKNKMMQDD